MRKLIRHAAVAFVAWAVVTFTWAAVSHATGAIGPAQASAASLGFVADAIDFVRPPAILSAPQRYASTRIRDAAHNAEHLHRGPERAVARLMDRLGHASAHRGDRRRHRHGHRHRSTKVSSNVVIHLDGLDRSADQRRRRAQIELQRHRSRADRQERIRSRIVQRVGRVPERVVRIERIHVGISDDDKAKLKRKGLEKLREILDELNNEAGNVNVDMLAELQSLGLENLRFEDTRFGEFKFDGDFDFGELKFEGDFGGEVEVLLERTDGIKSPVRVRIHQDR